MIATRPVVTSGSSDVFGAVVVFDDMLHALVKRTFIEVLPVLEIAFQLADGTPCLHMLHGEAEVVAGQDVIDVMINVKRIHGVESIGDVSTRCSVKHMSVVCVSLDNRVLEDKMGDG